MDRSQTHSRTHSFCCLKIHLLPSFQEGLGASGLSGMWRLDLACTPWFPGRLWDGIPEQLIACNWKGMVTCHCAWGESAQCLCCAHSKMLIPAFRFNHFSLWEGWHILTLSQQKCQIPVLVRNSTKEGCSRSSSQLRQVHSNLPLLCLGCWLGFKTRNKPHIRSQVLVNPYIRRPEWVKPFLWLWKPLNSSCPDSTPRKMGLPTLAVVFLMLRLWRHLQGHTGTQATWGPWHSLLGVQSWWPAPLWVSEPPSPPPYKWFSITLLPCSRAQPTKHPLHLEPCVSLPWLTVF